MDSYKGDNGNQVDYPTVKCSSWLLHDKVASHNLELSTQNYNVYFLLDCILLKLKTSSAAEAAPPDSCI